MLYARFPDWRLTTISDDVRQSLTQYEPPNLQPNLISGDFDGDGAADYALLITHGVTHVENNEIVNPASNLTIFLARPHGYKMFTINEPIGDYIALIHKGDKGYDYERQAEFIFTNDAIDAVTFEKAATSFVYEHGHFRAIISGD